ncbi:Dabb family protein [Planctomycetota bacterium]
MVEKDGSLHHKLAHNVFFALHDASDVQIETLIEACHSYLAAHEGIDTFAAGRIVTSHQRTVNVQDFQVGLHIIFNDKQSHDAYQESDRHQAFINRCRDNWANVRVFDTFVR